MTNITPIISIIFTLIVTCITMFLIPYIKENTDSKKLEKMLTVVKTAVEAAEQIYRESGLGKIKKEYVINYLSERGYTLNTNELDVLIESAVKELHKAFN